jgi:hypothetical protein
MMWNDGTWGLPKHSYAAAWNPRARGGKQRPQKIDPRHGTCTLAEHTSVWFARVQRLVPRVKRMLRLVVVQFEKSDSYQGFASAMPPE